MMSARSAGHAIAAAPPPPAGWVAHQLEADAFGFKGELAIVVDELTFSACARVGRFNAIGVEMADLLRFLASQLPADDNRGAMVRHALVALAELHRLRASAPADDDGGSFLVFDVQRGLAEIALTMALLHSERKASGR